MAIGAMCATLNATIYQYVITNQKKRKMMMIYLACPYTHPESVVREIRYQQALYVTGVLSRDKSIVYCPIVHNHNIANSMNMPVDFKFWREIDIEILKKADDLFVLLLPGWKDSIGLKAEIEFAESINIPITDCGFEDYL